jgi:hypothetical protein
MDAQSPSRFVEKPPIRRAMEKESVTQEKAVRVGRWAGFSSALLVAFGGSGLLTLSLVAAAKLLKAESLGFAQQSVGDTHRLLSSQIHREFSLLHEGLERSAEILVQAASQRSFSPTPGAPAQGGAVGAPLADLSAGGAHQERLTEKRTPAGRVAARGSLGRTKNKAAPVEKGASKDPPPTPVPAAPVVVPNFPSGVLELSIWARPMGESVSSIRAESVLNPKMAGQASAIRAGLKLLEARDRQLVEEAGKSGRALLLGAHLRSDGARERKELLALGNVISVAFSLPDRSGVVLGHYRLDAIEAALGADLLSKSALLDQRGRTLAGDDAALGQGSSAVKVFVLDAIKAGKDRFGMIRDFSSVAGSGPFPLLASFTRLQQAPVTLVTSISETDVLTGMDSLYRIAVASVVAVFLILFVVAFSQTRTQLRRLEAKQAAAQEVVEEKNEEVSQGSEPTRVYASVLVVSIRGLQGSVVAAPLLSSVSELLRDFRALVLQHAHQARASWVHEADGGIVVAFANPLEGLDKLDAPDLAAFRAVSLALLLRRDWNSVNTSRATEGHAPAYLGMAVHSGHALDFPDTQGGKPRLLVPIAQEARTLERLAASQGLDFLIPKAVFEPIRTLVQVELAGEAYLGDASGLSAYYRVRGLLRGFDGRAENVQEQPIESPWMKTPVEGRSSAIQLAEGSVRWFINNGSGIIGPFSPAEISAQLFAQEIDFDCDCWREDRGETRPILEADLFTGSEDAGAYLWVYDGKLVHGPLSPGFLGTALERGAIQLEGTFFCEGSTVQGWKPLSEWKPSESSTTPAPAATSAA